MRTHAHPFAKYLNRSAEKAHYKGHRKANTIVAMLPKIYRTRAAIMVKSSFQKRLDPFFIKFDFITFMYTIPCSRSIIARLRNNGFSDIRM